VTSRHDHRDVWSVTSRHDHRDMWSVTSRHDHRDMWSVTSKHDRDIADVKARLSLVVVSCCCCWLSLILFLNRSIVNVVKNASNCKHWPASCVMCGHPSNLWPFDLQIGTTVGNALTNFGLSAAFCLRVRSPYGTDRQTDRRTGKTRNAPITAAA